MDIVVIDHKPGYPLPTRVVLDSVAFLQSMPFLNVTQVPFTGFQLNYDLGDGKAVPSGGQIGSVLAANSYFLNIGTVAAVSYPFSLTEISAEENPVTTQRIMRLHTFFFFSVSPW